MDVDPFAAVLEKQISMQCLVQGCSPRENNDMQQKAGLLFTGTLTELYCRILKRKKKKKNECAIMLIDLSQEICHFEYLKRIFSWKHIRFQTKIHIETVLLLIRVEIQS